MKYILLILWSCNVLSATELDKIPFKDKVYLRHFCRRMVYSYQAGHVLLGSNKPLCLVPISTRPSGYFPGTLFMKGWRVWQKHSFPHRNYIFCVEERNFHGSSFTHLYLINKQQLHTCLEHYLDDFHEILGESFSPDQFVCQLEQGSSLRELLDHDELLLGLLMGYGKVSSKAFKEKNPDLILAPQVKYKLAHRGNCQYVRDLGIQPVRWAAVANSAEVEELTHLYREEQQKIYASFRHKDPLKVFLELLSQ